MKVTCELSAAPPEKRTPSHLSITVMDVARIAGVSAMTVSRALNKPETVPARTVEKVMAAVRETGYVPNRMAGGLRSSKSRLVAAIVPTLAGPVFLETIESLTRHLAAHGYHLMVGQSGYNDQHHQHDSREDELIADIVSRRPDGIVLTGVIHTAQARKRLEASGIPVVETWDLSADPIDMLIGFSHEQVGRVVAAYLIDKDRRRLAVVSGDDARARRRAESFSLECAERGLPAPRIHYVAAPTRLGDGRRALAGLLEDKADLDGVFCSSDLLALGVLIEAQSRGIVVPRQFAVVGFGDLDFAADVHPALTTVRIDGRRMGELAAGLVIARSCGSAIEQRALDIGFTIVERQSA